MTLNDIVQQVKALMAQRQEHEHAIILIDQQLVDIRRVLGVEPIAKAPKPTRKRSPWTGDGSSTEDRVLAALAQREPQTTTELKILGSTVPVLLTRMVNRGLLKRRAPLNGAGGKPLYVYARTEEALPPAMTADEEAASAIEAGAG